MSNPTSLEQPAEEIPERLPGKRLPWWAIVLLGMLVLGVLSLGGGWIHLTQKEDERLAVQVEKVRARSEPLTTVELNDFYQPAQNRPDMTAEIMTALAICEAPDLQMSATDLPIVGKGPEIPPPPETWPQREAVEAYLARQRAALDTFREVARRDGTARFPVDFTPGIATLLPHVQTMRQASRVLSLQFHVDLHAGHSSEAVDSILDQIALARVMDQEPILVAQLVRAALISVAVSQVQETLAHSDIADDDLVRLQQGLRKIDYQSCLKQALVGERTVGYTACVDPRQAEGGRALTPAEARQLTQRHPKRVVDATKMLELNLRISEAADRSLFAALQESERVDVEMRQLSLGTWNRFSYSMTILLAPAFRQAITGFARSAAKRDCADAALAAELYRRQHGTWPESLEQLVPEFLPSVPIDPFNNQPLKLVSTPVELKVYSVGRDGTDDHGNISIREDPNTDTGFVLPAKNGISP
ncbi:MAG TPA: hypothetical protein VGM05_15005 [Planctomycetaceae bacterium]|jgi:hypothetical protein